jgi:hypothetical protein
MNRLGLFILLILCSVGIVFIGIYENNALSKANVHKQEKKTSESVPVSIPADPVQEPVTELTIPPDTLLLRFISKYSRPDKVWSRAEHSKMIKPNLYSSHKKKMKKSSFEEADYIATLRPNQPLAICQWELYKEVKRYGGDIISAREYRNYQEGKSNVFLKIRLKETITTVQLIGAST